MDQFESIQQTVMPILVDYGLDVIGAFVILFVGLTVARWLSNRLQKYLERTARFDPTLTPLFVKGVKILIIALTVLTVLNQFGVETASLIAVLSTIGLAIGLALQGTLSNIASGIMLLILRPFNAGDAVDIAGTVGVVDEIGLFVTEMHTFDNIAITLPNSQIWGSKIENYSQNNSRRVDMEFGISYDDDINKAMNVVGEILEADERVLADPEPLIAVSSLGDNSVSIRVRPWTETSNVWPLRYDLIKRIKERFNEEDLSFPFPQRDVHVFRSNHDEQAEESINTSR